MNSSKEGEILVPIANVLTDSQMLYEGTIIGTFDSRASLWKGQLGLKNSINVDILFLLPGNLLPFFTPAASSKDRLLTCNWSSSSGHVCIHMYGLCPCEELCSENF